MQEVEAWADSPQPTLDLAGITGGAGGKEGPAHVGKTTRKGRWHVGSCKGCRWLEHERGERVESSPCSLAHCPLAYPFMEF
jgi:hypothetical protein